MRTFPGILATGRIGKCCGGPGSSLSSDFKCWYIESTQTNPTKRRSALYDLQTHSGDLCVAQYCGQRKPQCDSGSCQPARSSRNQPFYQRRWETLFHRIFKTLGPLSGSNCQRPARSRPAGRIVLAAVNWKRLQNPCAFEISSPGSVAVYPLNRL